MPERRVCIALNPIGRASLRLPYTWDDEVLLRMQDGNTPVALIAGRSVDFADLEAFAGYLGDFVGRLEEGWFTLTPGADAKGALSLHLGAEALLRVGGDPVNLSPRMLFDSPFLQSAHGSGSVTIQKGQRRLRIDMSKSELSQNGALSGPPLSDKDLNQTVPREGCQLSRYVRRVIPV